ncbi:hypothetical protein PIB30_071303 [Stylosanthes scabra]|uniref:Uncharacterized protein n=1 Tax=Stylosanthes scabra TaxID=79078 RepID=A0ABU6TNE4_9FABA|nr:hypothetical protein [Stylosanthes scabra]
MEDYLKVYASDKFAKYMASSSPFRSLDHAIDAAKDIFLTSLMVGVGLKLYPTRKFGSAFVTSASEKSSDKILSELKVRYTNMPLVELDIACQEEMKIELQLTNHYVDMYFDSDEVNSLENDHATEFDTNNDSRKNVRNVDGNQTKAEEHVRPKKGFDMNKEAW